MDFYVWRDKEMFKAGVPHETPGRVGKATYPKLVLLVCLSFEWAEKLFGSEVVEGARTASYAKPCRILGSVEIGDASTVTDAVEKPKGKLFSTTDT